MKLFARVLGCLGLLAAVGLGACKTATPMPRYADPDVIFKDDFSNPESGWDVYTGAEGSTQYVDGWYVISVDLIKGDLWGRPGLDVADGVVEADTQYGAGPANNEYGLICRYTRSGDKSNFYFFFISSDGYYVSGKVIEDVPTYLAPADFQASTDIQLEPTAINHLAATCAGSKMSFAINGVAVSEFEDAELKRGDVGLLAGSFDDPGVQIRFDNLVVRKP